MFYNLKQKAFQILFGDFLKAEQERIVSLPPNQLLAYDFIRENYDQ